LAASNLGEVSPFPLGSLRFASGAPRRRAGHPTWGRYPPNPLFSGQRCSARSPSLSASSAFGMRFFYSIVLLGIQRRLARKSSRGPDGCAKRRGGSPLSRRSFDIS